MLFTLLFELNSLPFEYKLVIFLTYVVAVVLALTIHECAHGFMAYKLGDPTAKVAGRITLNPMAHFDPIGLICFLILGFGWAKPVPVNPFNFKKIKRDSFLVSIAGVASNLVLAFIFCPLSMLLIPVAGNSVLLYALYCLCAYIYQVNLVLLVFNLLPIYPLDGFNAIASQLKYTNKFVTFMQKYGSFILIGMIILFNYTNLFEYLVYYVGYPIDKLWSLIIY